MDAFAASGPIAEPAVAPTHDEPSPALGGSVDERSARRADDRLARALRGPRSDATPRGRDAATERTEEADAPAVGGHAGAAQAERAHPTAGTSLVGGATPSAPSASSTHPEPTIATARSPSTAADATTSATPDAIPHPSADPTTPAGNPLRAWDSVRPQQDQIGGWRWHGGGWDWEDARGEHAAAPAWSRPTFAGTFDGFRVPLDSALTIRLYQNDPRSADTIAPGVIAHAAAALSDGRLAQANDVAALVPLMQRMTKDRQLDVAAGVAALRDHGAPQGLAPYATLKLETATFFEDGTRNQKDLASDHGGTNVGAMSTLMTLAHGDDARIPAPHYYGGPGNQKDFDLVMQGIGSATGAGIGGILNDVCGTFAIDLKSGLRDFAIFGFSRGAAEAVETTHEFGEIAAANRTSIRVGFLGLYDTVAAVGPTGDGHGALRLEPDRAGAAPARIYHAMSQDETRTKFASVDVGVTGVDHVIKDAFPGAHSDVGGSYANKGLSNIALHRMIEEDRRGGVPMPTLEQTIARHPEEAAQLLPFLHQDANQDRHFIDPIYSGTAVRSLAADVKPAESPQVTLHLETERVRNPDHDFDRRSLPYRDVTVGSVRVDPSGRFHFTDADPEPGIPPAPAQPRSPHRRDDDEGRGIAVPVRVVDGAWAIESPVVIDDARHRR